MKAQRPTCPSARASMGARLIGVGQASGTVAFVRSPIPLDDDLCQRLGEYPERRLRFASECVTGQCLRWEKGRCSVAAHVSAYPASSSGDLPECSIRPECRWHQQEGDEICFRCPRVFTDVAPRDGEESNLNGGTVDV